MRRTCRSSAWERGQCQPWRSETEYANNERGRRLVSPPPPGELVRRETSCAPDDTLACPNVASAAPLREVHGTRGAPVPYPARPLHIVCMFTPRLIAFGALGALVMGPVPVRS